MSVKKLRKLQFIQPTARSWSQWIPISGSELCCHCGLVHNVQYAVKKDRRGNDVLFKRVREHKGKTNQWRKQQVFQCRKV